LLLAMSLLHWKALFTKMVLARWCKAGAAWAVSLVVLGMVVAHWTKVPLPLAPVSTAVLPGPLQGVAEQYGVMDPVTTFRRLSLNSDNDVIAVFEFKPQKHRIGVLTEFSIEVDAHATVGVSQPYMDRYRTTYEIEFTSTALQTRSFLIPTRMLDTSVPVILTELEFEINGWRQHLVSPHLALDALEKVEFELLVVGGQGWWKSSLVNSLLVAVSFAKSVVRYAKVGTGSDPTTWHTATFNDTVTGSLQGFPRGLGGASITDTAGETDSMYKPYTVDVLLDGDAPWGWDMSQDIDQRTMMERRSGLRPTIVARVSPPIVIHDGNRERLVDQWDKWKKGATARGISTIAVVPYSKGDADSVGEYVTKLSSLTAVDEHNIISTMVYDHRDHARDDDIDKSALRMLKKIIETVHLPSKAPVPPDSFFGLMAWKSEMAYLELVGRCIGVWTAVVKTILALICI